MTSLEHTKQVAYDDVYGSISEVILSAKNQLVHYALDALPNKILAAEYKLALPDEACLVEKLSKIQKML